MSTLAQSKNNQLRKLLTTSYDRYHHVDFLEIDPLEFPHQYKNPLDQEAAAILSAVFAYGNVKQIKNSLRVAFNLIHQKNKSLSKAIQNLTAKDRHHFRPFFHRFNKSDDLFILLLLIQKSWEQYGSVGLHFLSYHASQDISFEKALIAFINDWKKWAQGFPFTQKTFYYLLNSPADQSCCKRWCMFLKWMGRKDALDLGLWMEGSPLLKLKVQKKHPPVAPLLSHQLVIPLDTHLGRFAKEFKLTKRKSLNWKAAIEVTQNLKKYIPEDPTRCDFALTRRGMLERVNKTKKAISLQ